MSKDQRLSNEAPPAAERAQASGAASGRFAVTGFVDGNDAVFEFLAASQQSSRVEDRHDLFIRDHPVIDAEICHGERPVGQVGV